jgi:hypothetical protein
MFQLLGWEVDTVTRVVGLVEDRKKKNRENHHCGEEKFD